MKRIFRMVLPSNADPGAAEQARQDLAELDGVESARLVRPRSGAADVMLRVSVAANVVGIAAAGVSLLDRVRRALRKRRLEGVHIELPDGVRVSVDSATPEEVQKLVTALEQARE
ncbi:MAG: hypothetical protein ACT4P7_07185 [Gemmatimonadaceae bacterium]